jgi:hypothetical protein
MHVSVLRKTFITNSIVPEMNSKTIKDITGPEKDSVFNKNINDCILTYYFYLNTL